MKRILILPFICFIFGNTLTAPVYEESKAIIENYENNRGKNGNYNFSFKTSNGIGRSENGDVINTGSLEYMTVRGEYSYVDPNGRFIRVRYYADDTGFHVILPQILESKSFSYSPAQDMSISGILNPSVVASLLGVEPESDNPN